MLSPARPVLLRISLVYQLALLVLLLILPVFQLQQLAPSFFALFSVYLSLFYLLQVFLTFYLALCSNLGHHLNDLEPLSLVHWLFLLGIGLAGIGVPIALQCYTELGSLFLSLLLAKPNVVPL